ncbi:hypothetical protein LTR62_003970 [Meristemomyces frigidus]|uniref:NmrA-like domain-containing protein n=1 Tax=Meristemomyces frigidus TaxID=1508187 RepID=A0AAN7YAS5_9PEZI|nr:hypothetical protein LTR62_003970 [Meristemomyces frigidus]
MLVKSITKEVKTPCKVLVWVYGQQRLVHSLIDSLMEDGNYQVAVLVGYRSNLIFRNGTRILRTNFRGITDDLISSIQGHEILVSSVGGHIQMRQHLFVAKVAAVAGIRRYILPECASERSDHSTSKTQLTTQLTDLAILIPSFSWTAIACGIWLDVALAKHRIFIDTLNHHVCCQEWSQQSLTMTTMAYTVSGFIAVMKKPNFAVNQRVYLRGMEISQSDIITELERRQHVVYTGLVINSDERAQTSLISTVMLNDEHAGPYRQECRTPVLEDSLHIGSITLESVIEQHLQEQCKELHSEASTALTSAADETGSISLELAMS